MKKTKKKSYNRISSNKVLKTKKLSKKEKKYCSCLMKVRPKINNPYGICTSAIYNKQGQKRNKSIKCSKYYDFSKYSLLILRPYAKEKKIKNYSKLKKNDLIKLLEKLNKNK